MLYNVFILTLMISGLATVAVFSYKIARSPIFPVGIVQERPPRQSLLERDLGNEAARLWAGTHAVPEWAGRHAVPGKRFEIAMQDLLMRGDVAQCRTVLREDDESKDHAWVVAVDEGVVLIDRRSSVEMDVAGQGEQLSSHEKILRAFEKRIRQLEVESVAKIQAAAEDTPQAGQAAIVH
jgi:hypothetical protein